MAGRRDETPEQRYLRLRHTAEVMRRAADDAIQENNRAYDRANEAVVRAEAAEHEAATALGAWQRSLIEKPPEQP